jgi:hypothetical protein
MKMPSACNASGAACKLLCDRRPAAFSFKDGLTDAIVLWHLKAGRRKMLVVTRGTRAFDTAAVNIVTVEVVRILRALCHDVELAKIGVR